MAESTADLFAQEHELLALADVGGEFLDGGLAADGFVSFGGGGEPGGEGGFARGGARVREEFKEAAAAEEVEVVCVQVVGVFEAGSGIAGSAPVVREPLEALLVVAHGTAGELAALVNSQVDDEECNEGEDWGKEPEGGEDDGAEGEVGEDGGSDRGEKA